MSRFRRPAAAILAVATFWPTLVFGQAPRAGVVTTLEGNVTVTRVALPQPQPLRFKDDVFVNDKVTTGDKAIARMLLGGKAVVTVRERSSLTITEVPGKSTIDLDAGKIALAIAKDKMKPGESIEIRTQNAVAGVRGTVVVAEVSRATAQVGGAAPTLTTSFYILRGQIEAIQINTPTGQPVGPPVTVGTLQQFRATGISPAALTNIPPGQIAQIVQGLSSSKPQHSGGGDDAAKDNAVNETRALLDAITGGGEGQLIIGPPPPPLITENPRPSVPILPVGSQCTDSHNSGCGAAAVPGPPPPGPPPSGLTNAFVTIDRNVTLPDALFNQDNLATISGTVNWGNLAAAPPENGPYGRINGATVGQVAGNTAPMVDVQGTLNLLSGNGLLEVLNATVNGNGPLVRVSGTITQTTPPTGSAAPLILIDPSTVAPGCCADIVSITGNLDAIGGQVLKSIDGTLISFASIVNLTGTVNSSTTSPLVDLSGGHVSYGLGESGSVVSINGTVSTLGGLLRASGVTFHPSFGDAMVTQWGGTLTTFGPIVELIGGADNGFASILGLIGGGAHINGASPAVLLIGGAVTSDHVVDVQSGAQLFVNTFGGLLSVNGVTSLTPSAAMLHVAGLIQQGSPEVIGLASSEVVKQVASKVGVAAPFISINASHVSATNESNLIQIESSGTVHAASQFFRAVASDIDAGHHFLKVGGSLTGGSSEPLLDFSGGSLAWGSHSGASFLNVSGGSIVTSGGLVRFNGATLIPSAGSPFIEVTGEGSLVAGGPLLELNGILHLGSDTVLVGNGGATRVTSGPAFTVVGGALTAGGLIDSFPNLTIPSTLLEVSGATVHLDTGVPIGTLTVTGGSTPLFLFTNNANVNLGAGLAIIHAGETLNLPPDHGGLLSAFNSTITAGTSGTFTPGLIVLEGASTLTANTANPLITLDNSFVNLQSGETSQALLAIGQNERTALTLTGGAALLRIQNQTAAKAAAITGGTGTLVTINNADVSVSGLVFDIVNSTLTLPTMALVGVAGASTITTTGADAAFRLINATVTVNNLLSSSGLGNTYTLTGPGLEMTNSTLTANRLGNDPGANTDVFNFAPTPASLNVPFGRLTNSTLTVTGNEHDLFGLGDDSRNPTTFGVSVVATDSTINLPASLARFERLTSNAPDPMVQLTRVTVNQSGAGEDRALMTVNSLSGVTFAGPMARIDGSRLNLSRSLFSVEAGGTTFSGAGLPVIDILNSTIAALEDVVGVGVSTSLTTAGALLRVNAGTLNARSIFRMDGNTTAVLGGTLLNAIGSPSSRAIFNAAGDFVRIGDGSVFTSPAADPVILSTFATFNVGLAPLQHAHFFLVNSASGSAPAQASISGPLLNSSHDGFNIAAGFLETSGGLTGNAPITFQRLGPGAALTTFSDSTLRLGVGGGGTGNFIDVGPNTAMAIDGTIAAVSGSGSTAPWTLDRLLLAQCGFSAACTPGAGTPGLDTNGSVAPLFTFNGGFSGVHTVNQEMFSLIGEQLTPEPDPDSDVHGRFLGADQPVRHGGTLYQGTGGSMTVNKVMQVDRALFNASAPIVSLIANSTLNVATNGLEVANLGRVKATLPSGDAMFKLNASTLNVLNGHLVSLSGSTFMSVVGDLLRLFNGSTASITNGGLVSVSGSSVFRLTGGSLAVFGGTGANALNVAGTTTLGGTLVTNVTNLAGVPVLLRNGANANQVSVTPGFNAFSGGTPTFGSSGAALVVDGTSAKIKLGP